MSRIYTVVCERSDGWWALSVPDLPGVYSQARRLDQAEAMACEVITLWLEVPEDEVEVELRPQLAPAIQQAIERWQQSRERSSAAQAAATEASAGVARAMARAGLSVRDSGRLLGISYQRVSQLLSVTKGRRAS